MKIFRKFRRCSPVAMLFFAIALKTQLSPAATITVTAGDPIAWGRRMVGATPSNNVTLTKNGGGTQAYTNTLNNNGITAPNGSISGGNGSTGTLAVTLVNNANGSGTTGSKAFTVDVSPGSGDSHIDATVTVLSQRSVTTDGAVAFGSLLRNAQVSQVVNLSTTGDDNNRTRVTVGSTLGADANGISVSAASGTSFNSAASTGTRTLSGVFSSYGSAIVGGPQLAVTTAEAAGVGDSVAYSPVTLGYTVTVGNATADASNSASAFGPALTAQVTLTNSYANLESRTFGTTGSGGSPMLGSVATILDGGNSSGTDTGVSMEWRTRTTGEMLKNESGIGNPTYPPLYDTSSLTSDVVRLSGMVNNAAIDPRQTDIFTFQMTYAQSLLRAPEATLAGAGLIFLAYMDSNGVWKNAVNGNIGGPGTVGTPVLSSYAAYLSGTAGSHGAKTANTFQLGDWGVDTSNDVVWAVLNYNGTFASVPEPSTFVLGALGMLLAGCLAAKRRG